MSDTYQSLEVSPDGGLPVELFDITVNGTTYYLTTATDRRPVSPDNSGTSPLLFNGNTYTPTEISREQVVLSAENRVQVLNITLPAGHAVPQAYATSVPGVHALLKIRRAQRRMFQSPATWDTLFIGMVRAVAFNDDDTTATIAVVPISGAMSRTLPRFTYQSLCNHVLFDPWCTISSAAFRYIGTAGSLITAVQFDVSGLGAAHVNDWATAGYAIFNGDYRMIIKQLGNTVTLLVPFNTSPSGSSVQVFAGCDHSLSTCNSKFSNGINFGGFPFVPTLNPFVSGIQ